MTRSSSSSSTVNVLYKNPLFKNLRNYLRRDSQIQVASKLRTLGYPRLPGSGSYFIVGWKWFRCGLACYENTRNKNPRVYFAFQVGRVLWGQGFAKGKNEVVSDTYFVFRAWRGGVGSGSWGEGEGRRRGSRGQKGRGGGAGAGGQGRGKGKNELVSDTTSFFVLGGAGWQRQLGGRGRRRRRGSRGQKGRGGGGRAGGQGGGKGKNELVSDTNSFLLGAAKFFRTCLEGAFWARPL